MLRTPGIGLALGGCVGGTSCWYHYLTELSDGPGSGSALKVTAPTARWFDKARFNLARASISPHILPR